VGCYLNRGQDLAPDFYRAVQFDRILYRPDVVAESFRIALGPGQPPASSSLANATFRIAQLREIAPPRLRLLLAALEGLADGRPRATLRLDGERNALAIKDYAVFVNGIPVTERERLLSGGDVERFRARVGIDRSAGGRIRWRRSAESRWGRRNVTSKCRRRSFVPGCATSMCSPIGVNTFRISAT
jgi:hypothetical protein